MCFSFISKKPFFLSSNFLKTKTRSSENRSSLHSLPVLTRLGCYRSTAIIFVFLCRYIFNVCMTFQWCVKSHQNILVLPVSNPLRRRMFQLLLCVQIYTGSVGLITKVKAVSSATKPQLLFDQLQTPRNNPEEKNEKIPISSSK